MGYELEKFAKPGVAGIIEKIENGTEYILIQQRVKKDAPAETGMFEIPAGKIREFENIFDCLRREIKEETGLDVVEITGEKDSSGYTGNGYRVLSYTPFASAQNMAGEYPIMVQTFICHAAGEILKSSNESQSIAWMPLHELKDLLYNNEEKFYPMHVETLKKYLRLKLKA